MEAFCVLECVSGMFVDSLLQELCILRTNIAFLCTNRAFCAQIYNFSHEISIFVYKYCVLVIIIIEFRDF